MKGGCRILTREALQPVGGERACSRGRCGLHRLDAYNQPGQKHGIAWHFAVTPLDELVHVGLE